MAEIFWRAAGDSTDRTPQAVVRQALAAITAFDQGAVTRPDSNKAVTLMELLAEIGIEENLVYASPELARGESIDERSLVFTIGVLIFERLTERHPFGSADNPDRVARIRRCEMGSGVNFFPSVPKELRTILMRCMGPFPEERYRDLSQLKEELGRFVGPARRSGAEAPAREKFLDAPTVVSAASGRVAASDLARPPSRELDALPTREVPEPSRPPPGSALGAPSPVRLAARRLRGSGEERALPVEEPGSLPFVEDRDLVQESDDHIPLPSQPMVYGSRPVRPVPVPVPVPAPLPLPPAIPSSRLEGSSLGPWAPVIYGLLGAGIASLLFLVISFGRSSSRSHRPVVDPPAGVAGLRRAAPAPTLRVVPPPAAAASRTKLVRPEPKAEPRPEPKAEPRPEPKAEPRPEPKAEPRPEPKADPALEGGEAGEIKAGKVVGEIARSCGIGWGGARSVRIGAFLRPNGKIVRGLANQKQGISKTELACLRKELAGRQLPLRWTEAGYVEWSLRIFSDRVEAVVVGPADLTARLRRR